MSSVYIIQNAEGRRYGISVAQRTSRTGSDVVIRVIRTIRGYNSAEILARRGRGEDRSHEAEASTLYGRKTGVRPPHVSPKSRVARLQLGDPAGRFARLNRVQGESAIFFRELFLVVNQMLRKPRARQQPPLAPCQNGRLPHRNILDRVKGVVI